MRLPETYFHKVSSVYAICGVKKIKQDEIKNYYRKGFVVRVVREGLFEGVRIPGRGKSTFPGPETKNELGKNKKLNGERQRVWRERVCDRGR